MSQDIRCGEIYTVDFDPPKGQELKVGSEIIERRPAVVMSRNAINKARRTVMVVPLSSCPAPMEIFAVAVPSAGLQSVAVCDQLTTVNKSTRVLNRVGTLAAADLRAVEIGVMDAMSLR